MKRGGLGGAILLAAAAIFALALNHAHSPARAPVATPHLAEAPPPQQDALPPEPPPTPSPEPPIREGPGARLVGRVTDDEGRPVADAGIWLSKGKGPGEGEVVSRTAVDGRYLVDGVDGEERLVGAIAAKHAPSDLRRIAPQTQAVFEIDFTLRRGGGTLAIAIDSESADVLIEPVFLESPESGGRRHVEINGRGTVEGLAAEWSVLRIRAAGRAPRLQLVRISPEGVTDIPVTLSAGATLLGTVRGSDGTPAAGALVKVAGWEWAELGTACDENGAYRMEHLPAGAVEAYASLPDGGKCRADLDLVEGEAFRWDPVLELPLDLDVRVIDEEGAPVAGASVVCRRASIVERALTDPDGTFRFARLPRAKHRLAAWWPDRDGGAPAAEATAVPGGPLVTITLPRAEGSLRGVLVNRTGGPAAGARVRIWPSLRPEWEVRALTEADGSFRLAPLPPGRYFLELHADGEPTLHRSVITLGWSETDLGVLRFPRGGRVRARLLDGNGAAVPDAHIVVVSPDRTVTYDVRRDGDAFLSEELVPGRYLACEQVVSGLVQEVDVLSEATTAVDLKIRLGGTLELAALDEHGDRALARFRIEDDRGSWVAGDGSRTDRMRARLPAGTYRVVATDDSGRVANADVRIGEDDATTRVVLQFG